jgi:hypothetical protein
MWCDIRRRVRVTSDGAPDRVDRGECELESHSSSECIIGDGDLSEPSTSRSYGNNSSFQYRARQPSLQLLIVLFLLFWSVLEVSPESLLPSDEDPVGRLRHDNGGGGPAVLLPDSLEELGAGAFAG